jgi:hypothetical protein
MYYISKIIFTALCVLTIIIPSVMDINKTHMSNPAWPPHARLHWGVQYLATTSLQIAALYLLWANYAEKNSVLISFFSGFAPMLFWGMLLPAQFLFPGTSSWPDGVTPPRGFPAIFKKFHPNMIMGVLITLIAVLGIWLDLKQRGI